MLSVADLRLYHPHFFAARADLLDALLEAQIALVWAEFGETLEQDIQIVAEAAAAQAVCHRMQIQFPSPNCSPVSKMVGRPSTVQSETDRITTNAKGMDNTSDWASTGCGGLFKKYIENSSLGIAPICGCYF
jgi:hypothetical protein